MAAPNDRAGAADSTAGKLGGCSGELDRVPAASASSYRRRGHIRAHSFPAPPSSFMQP